jgi:hypothetical protein
MEGQFPPVAAFGNGLELTFQKPKYTGTSTDRYRFPLHYCSERHCHTGVITTVLCRRQASTVILPVHARTGLLVELRIMTIRRYKCNDWGRAAKEGINIDDDTPRRPKLQNSNRE